MLEMGRTWEAVCAFHEALGVQPQDPIATDLLGRALEENASVQGWGSGGDGGDGNFGVGGSFGSAGGEGEDEGFERFIGERKKGVREGKRVVLGKGKRRGGGGGGGAGGGEDSLMIMSDGEG